MSGTGESVGPLTDDEGLRFVRAFLLAIPLALFLWLVLATFVVLILAAT